MHIYFLTQKKEENINIAYNFEKKHILFKNTRKVFYSTQFIVIRGLNKLTKITELMVQSENLRMSPTVHDEFKSFNFKHERRYLYELVGRNCCKTYSKQYCPHTFSVFSHNETISMEMRLSLSSFLQLIHS